MSKVISSSKLTEGTIPLALQNYKWWLGFDLSFNKFTGVLSEDMQPWKQGDVRADTSATTDKLVPDALSVFLAHLKHFQTYTADTADASEPLFNRDAFVL
eukprot:gene33061-40804_t